MKYSRPRLLALDTPQKGLCLDGSQAASSGCTTGGALSSPGTCALGASAPGAGCVDGPSATNVCALGSGALGGVAPTRCVDGSVPTSD